MNTDFSPADIAHLTNELLRVTTHYSANQYGKFTTADGEAIEGATESDVIKHLTSGREYVKGRQVRFPGIANGFVFPEAIKAAGFRIVRARNYRSQLCSVVTL